MKGGATAPPAVAKSYKHLHFPPEQAETLLESLAVEDGIDLGLPEIDLRTRGFRPKDLVVITGFAHAGKTQLVNTMVVNNLDKRILFFSLDDPAEMILAKLVAMLNGMSSVELERRVRAGDAEARAIVRDVAANQLRNLIVVDTSMGIPTMQEAIAEATDHWNALPHAVVIDFLELVPGDGRSDDQAANVKSKSRAMKAFANQLAWPTIVLHQGTRSNAKPGSPITLVSAAFGGEQEATILLGVRRKRDFADLEASERNAHLDTVTIHLVKNKRPGGKLTHHDGIDFRMDQETGLISEIHGPRMMPTSSAVAASQATSRARPIWNRDDLD